MDAQWVVDMRSGLEDSCMDGRKRHRADTIYLIVMGARVIMMQTGYAMLESAVVRQMNAANIMMKGFVDLLLGCLAWYALGDYIAYPKINDSPMPWEGRVFDYALWFLHLSYVVTAATITSAALAERVSFWPHATYVATFVFVVYPVAVWCVWGGGWLERMGFIDYAGSAVVHMVGALASLVSCCICGPRIGRYPNYRGWHGIWRYVFLQHYPDDYFWPPVKEPEKSIFTTIRPVANPVQMLYGMLSLLVGFIALSPAATSTVENQDLEAARLTVMTLLSAAAGCVASYIASIIKEKAFVMTVPEFATAVIAAAVSSCACCNVVTPLGALICGFVGSVLALLSQEALDKAQVDDPIKAASAHGLPGAWGVLCVPLLASPNCHSDLRGLVYGGGSAAWELLGKQVLGLLVLGGWTIVSTYICVFIVESIVGLRCSRGAELVGLDFTEHDYDNGFAGRQIVALRHCLQKRSLLHRLGPWEDLTLVRKACQRHSFQTLQEPADNTGMHKTLKQSDSEPLQGDVSAMLDSIQEAMHHVKALQGELAKAKQERRASESELWSALRFLNSKQSRKKSVGTTQTCSGSTLTFSPRSRSNSSKLSLRDGAKPEISAAVPPAQPQIVSLQKQHLQHHLLHNGSNGLSKAGTSKSDGLESDLQEILQTTLQELAADAGTGDVVVDRTQNAASMLFTTDVSGSVLVEGNDDSSEELTIPDESSFSDFYVDHHNASEVARHSAKLHLEELHNILHNVLHDVDLVDDETEVPDDGVEKATVIVTSV